MYKHILIATDGSDLAAKALDHGLTLAKHVNARVTVVTVTEPWSALDMAAEARERKADPVGQFEAMGVAAAQRILDDAAARGKAQGVACEFVHVKDRHPADGIVTTARDRGCDLIVMASHGRRGAARFLLGSQANEVLATASVPALIVR